jgi:hypothetical protein
MEHHRPPAEFAGGNDPLGKLHGVSLISLQGRW